LALVARLQIQLLIPIQVLILFFPVSPVQVEVLVLEAMLLQPLAALVVVVVMMVHL
jgi:hypothetical protein